MKRSSALAITGLAILLPATPSLRAQNDLNQRIDKELPSLLSTYKHLHENPELSMQEKETSALLAGQLRTLGYEVTDHFGVYAATRQQAYGIVAVLKNGAGPTVMVRTELDGLPVEEKTGVPYASHAKAKRADGTEVSVMHACGHDLHMTVFLGTAKMLVELKKQWKGTVILIGQPAEEVVEGAKAMLQDGLYNKFPEPDYVLALHDSSVVPAGKVAWLPGPALAGADSVDITVRGYGGHGAMPHLTKDPIVVAAEIVVALQTITSREQNPFDPIVVTVGSFHAGTKHNIIPDEAHLQLTVRTLSPQTREKVLAAIARVTNGIAAAAGIPAERAPIIEVAAANAPVTSNDPKLALRVFATLGAELGKDNVLAGDPIMASEDFSEFGLAGHKPPYVMFWLGATDPQKLAAGKEKGTRIPGLHSGEFVPLPEPAIRTGVRAMTATVLDLMKK